MSVSCREVDMLLIRCTSHFFFWGYLSLLLSLSGKIVALITSMGKSSLRVQIVKLRDCKLQFGSFSLSLFISQKICTDKENCQNMKRTCKFDKLYLRLHLDLLTQKQQHNILKSIKFFFPVQFSIFFFHLFLPRKKGVGSPYLFPCWSLFPHLNHFFLFFR